MSEVQSMSQNSDVAIKVSGVWKIFGDAYQEALDAIVKDKLSKAEVLERFDCVIGVNDANFEVNRGEIFCVMGLSGSGKSTLVRHINRLLMPTTGQIFVNGVDVMAINESELMRLRNRHIAMVFQSFGLMPHRSVRDNVAMPLEVRGLSQSERWEAAEKALAMVDLSEWPDKFAHELSGGMQQRVGLARAIAADSEILLMDEPFSALDPLIRRQLQDEFMKLAAVMNKTTVFITHDLDEAIRIGDRIAIMRDGEIVQMGTPEEIVLNPCDDYVSDFVAGISRVNLIQAHSLMRPIAAYERDNGRVPGDAPVMHEDATLSDLIARAVDSENPILIRDGDGKTVGLLTKNDLLNGVMAGGAAA